MTQTHQNDQNHPETDSSLWQKPISTAETENMYEKEENRPENGENQAADNKTPPNLNFQEGELAETDSSLWQKPILPEKPPLNLNFDDKKRKNQAGEGKKDKKQDEIADNALESADFDPFEQKTPPNLNFSGKTQPKTDFDDKKRKNQAAEGKKDKNQGKEGENQAEDSKTPPNFDFALQQKPILPPEEPPKRKKEHRKPIYTMNKGPKVIRRKNQRRTEADSSLSSESISPPDSDDVDSLGGDGENETAQRLSYRIPKPPKKVLPKTPPKKRGRPPKPKPEVPVEKKKPGPKPKPKPVRIGRPPKPPRIGRPPKPKKTGPKPMKKVGRPASEIKGAMRILKDDLPIVNQCRAEENGMQCRRIATMGSNYCAQHYAEYEQRTCKRILKNGKICGRPLINSKGCMIHSTYKERATYRKRCEASIEGTFEPIQKTPIQKVLQRVNPYEGTKVILEDQTIQVKNGDVYGFYNGDFLTIEQREIFKMAPVGTIDDDIRVIRWLLRDVWKNQILFLQAKLAGNEDVDGWVEFSKEVTIGQGKNNESLTSTKIIQRKKDYMSDIEKLTKLLTTMEQARVQIQAALKESHSIVVPFQLNVLPPSEALLAANKAFEALSDVVDVESAEVLEVLDNEEDVISEDSEDSDEGEEWTFD